MWNFTNITRSICNVPFNPEDGAPKYEVYPGQTVGVPDSYIAGLSEETKARLLSVTTGPDPLFTYEQVAEIPLDFVPEPLPRKGARRDARSIPSPIS